MIKRPSKLPYATTKTPTMTSLRHKKSMNYNSSHPSNNTITPKAHGRPTSPTSFYSGIKISKNKTNEELSKANSSENGDSSIKNIEVPASDHFSPSRKRKKSFSEVKVFESGTIPSVTTSRNMSDLLLETITKAIHNVTTTRNMSDLLLEAKTKAYPRPTFSRRNSVSSKIDVITSPHSASPRFPNQYQNKRASKNDTSAGFKVNLQQLE